MLDMPVLTSWTKGRIVILGGKLQSSNSCLGLLFFFHERKGIIVKLPTSRVIYSKLHMCLKFVVPSHPTLPTIYMLQFISMHMWVAFTLKFLLLLREFKHSIRKYERKHNLWMTLIHHIKHNKIPISLINQS